MDQSTKDLLKYCKKSKAKRGLEYVSQIDSQLLEVESDKPVRVRQALYVHTQFKTIHLRQIVQVSNKIVVSHYY